MSRLTLQHRSNHLDVKLNLIFEFRHFAEFIRLVDELVERRAIQNSGGGIAHFLHHATENARSFIRTIIATRIGGLAHAGYRCQRAVDKANNAAQGNRIRRTLHEVAALPAFAALQNALVAQIEQNSLEEFPRNVERFRNGSDLNGAFALMLGKMNQRPESVFRPF